MCASKRRHWGVASQPACSICFGPRFRGWCRFFPRAWETEALLAISWPPAVISMTNSFYRESFFGGGGYPGNCNACGDRQFASERETLVVRRFPRIEESDRQDAGRSDCRGGFQGPLIFWWCCLIGISGPSSPGVGSPWQLVCRWPLDPHRNSRRWARHSASISFRTMQGLSS